jgi:hypothetical protein
MQAEPRDDRVCVWMTKEEAQSLLRELDKWPELPKGRARPGQRPQGAPSHALGTRSSDDMPEPSGIASEHSFATLTPDDGRVARES